jgi:hypothetical protein
LEYPLKCCHFHGLISIFIVSIINKCKREDKLKPAPPPIKKHLLYVDIGGGRGALPHGAVDRLLRVEHGLRHPPVPLQRLLLLQAGVDFMKPIRPKFTAKLNFFQI